MILFDTPEDALEEASWCAKTYGTRHAIIAYSEKFGVCDIEEVQPAEQIVEICNATAPLCGPDHDIED